MQEMQGPILVSAILSGLGLLAVLLISIALMQGGASLFPEALDNTRLDLKRAGLAWLASVPGTAIAFLIVAPLVYLALKTVFNENVLNLISTLALLSIVVFVLAACIMTIVGVRKRAGYALALFTFGGQVLLMGLAALVTLGVTSGMMNTVRGWSQNFVDPGGSLKSAALLTSAAAILLMGAGYLIGANRIGQFTDDSEMITAPPPPPPPPLNIDTLPAAAYLTMNTGKGRGQRYELHPGEIKIGRHSACAVHIDGDEEVSREHCKLNISPSGSELRDAGSKNGTFLNGVKVVDGRRLQTGDEIRVGDSSFTFTQV